MDVPGVRHAAAVATEGGVSGARLGHPAAEGAGAPGQLVPPPVPPPRGYTGRTLLGTTAGAAAVLFAGSLIIWPAADFFFGPRLSLLGMKSPPTAAVGRGGTDLKSEAEVLLAERAIAQIAAWERPCLSIVRSGGSSGMGRRLEVEAYKAERPVVYISLREASSPHCMALAAQASVYACERLGAMGTLINSMGVWWLVLFDIIVGHEPEQTRAFNYSVVMQHLRRALRLHKRVGGPRPLIIVDHFDEAASYVQAEAKDIGSLTLRAMLLELAAWCAVTCYDDGLADIVLVSNLEMSWWRPRTWGFLQIATTASQYYGNVRRWLP